MDMYYGVGHEDVEYATGYKIVYGLMDGYKNKNYIMTCDNFSFSLHCFGIFWRLGCMPQGFEGLGGLIVRGGLVCWLLIQRKDQEDNFGIACVLQVILLVS